MRIAIARGVIVFGEGSRLVRNGERVASYPVPGPGAGGIGADVAALHRQFHTVVDVCLRHFAHPAHAAGLGIQTRQLSAFILLPRSQPPEDIRFHNRIRNQFLQAAIQSV